MRNRHESLWYMIFAPGVWAVHFVAVYGWAAVICAKGAPFALARGGIAVLTIIALGLILWHGVLAWRQWDFLDDGDHVHDRPTTNDRREFLGHAGLLLAIVAFVGVVFVSLPALLIGNCR